MSQHLTGWMEMILNIETGSTRSLTIQIMENTVCTCTHHRMLDSGMSYLVAHYVDMSVKLAKVTNILF